MEKVTIEGYSDEKFESQVGTFEVMFNPKSFDEKWVVQYFTEQPVGTSSQTQIFRGIKPQDYKFEFVLDGTGTAAPKIDVAQEVDNFREGRCAAPVHT